LCTVAGSHTLNIGCRCGLIGASHVLTPHPPTPSFHDSFDGSSPTGTYQKRTKFPRKKEKETKSRMIFFFFWCVMSVHVLICTAAAAQCHRSPCFPQSFHLI
jgi:hypothetical protein